jgi:NADH-quinone oxidoreductase subunit N
MFALFASEFFLPAVILYFMTAAAFTGKLRKLNFMFNPLLLTANIFLIIFFLAIVLLFNLYTDFEIFYFTQGLVYDSLGFFSRAFIYICTLPVIVFFSRFYSTTDFKPPYELFILIGYAVVGMVFLTATTDLLLAYIFIELQALSFYLLAATNRYSVYSLEAGLKYFLLGGLASVSLLFGISILYGLTGSTNLLVISLLTDNFYSYADSLFVLALGLILFTFMFKLSAFPFHFWTPDVYTGSPLPVTAFFSILTKLGYLIFLIRFCYYLSAVGNDVFFYFFTFAGLCTIFIGSFAALFQSNLKRFLAYSTINNIGFILLGLSTGTCLGYSSAIFYLVVYMALSIGVFSFLFLFSSKDSETPFVESFNDLKVISKTNFAATVVFSFFVLSFAGVPPLAGFYSKYFIFMALLDNANYVSAFFAAILSVFSAFYYLRVIKYLFFLEPTYVQNFVTRINLSWSISYIFAFAALVNFSFLFLFEKLFVYINFLIVTSIF